MTKREELEGEGERWEASNAGRKWVVVKFIPVVPGNVGLSRLPSLLNRDEFRPIAISSSTLQQPGRLKELNFRYACVDHGTVEGEQIQLQWRLLIPVSRAKKQSM
jgi:hypothetical protein